MTTPKAPVINFQTLMILGQSIGVKALPDVPGDRKEVLEAGAASTWRIADSNRTEAATGLDELAAAQVNLGDLAPAPSDCAKVVSELRATWDLLARLEALAEYAEARRAQLELKADAMLHAGADEAIRRIERGLINAESFPALRKYDSAHGNAVSLGRARAAKVRAEMKQEPANGNATPAKNGTDPV